MSEIIRCDVSELFPAWLSRAGGSIVLTIYQAGKAGMIGWDGRQVTLLFRDFTKPMGLDVELLCEAATPGVAARVPRGRRLPPRGGRVPE